MAAKKPPASEVPAGLQSRGSALWVALGQRVDTPAGALALEACRTADRLDELDSVIAGKGVLNLMAFRLGFDDELETGEREIHVTVGFQNVLGEARQQQLAFKAMLAELGLAATPAAPATPAPKNALEEMRERRQREGRAK